MGETEFDSVKESKCSSISVLEWLIRFSGESVTDHFECWTKSDPRTTTGSRFEKMPLLVGIQDEIKRNER